MKKQRNVLISYILFYGGFFILVLSILCLIIYTIVLNNHKVNFIHLICFVLIVFGLIAPFFASMFNLYFYFQMHNPNYKLNHELRKKTDNGFIQGVPNNHYYDFKSLEDMQEGTIVLDYKYGIFKGEYNKHSIIIDMKGWTLKRIYLYELLHTILRLKYVENHKLPLKYMYKKIESDDIPEIRLVIRRGKKTKEYLLFREKVIKSSLMLSMKNHKKSKFISNKKISILDFYNLNI